MRTQRVYVASSWLYAYQQTAVAALRDAGFEVYDFRHPAPGNNGFAWSAIDPDWQKWTPEQFRAALKHPVAVRAYDGMKWADACVLVLPCGRSAHLEAGWMAGAGKRVLVWCAELPEPELMYGLLHGMKLTLSEVVEDLRR